MEVSMEIAPFQKNAFYYHDGACNQSMPYNGPRTKQIGQATRW